MNLCARANKNNKKNIKNIERYYYPIIDELKIKDYYNRLEVNNKNIYDLRLKGIIKRLIINEQNGWLNIYVDYLDEKEKLISNLLILKCKFEDVIFQKFILYNLKNYNKKFTYGNLSAKILDVPIPRFDKNFDTNLEKIKLIMESYLKNMRARYHAHL